MITAGPIYEPFLTDHIINYPVAGAVADIVCPRVRAESDRGEYEVYDKTSFKVVNIKPRVGMASAEIHKVSSGSDTYETKNYPLRMPLTNKFIKEQQKIGKNPELTRAEQLKSALVRARELRVSTAFAAVTNSVTLLPYNASTNTFLVQMDDFTNSKPFDIIQYYCAYFAMTCGILPNKILLNPFIEYTLATHPNRDTKSSQNVDKVSNPSLGNTLLNMEIVRGFMPYDTTKAGRTASNSFIWGNNIYLLYIAPDVSSESPTAAKTFDSGEFEGRTTGISVAQYAGNAGEPGIYIEAQESVDEKITCSSAIFIIKSVLANATPTVD